MYFPYVFPKKRKGISKEIQSKKKKKKSGEEWRKSGEVRESEGKRIQIITTLIMGTLKYSSPSRS
jgi:hypothetical protein